MIFVVTYLICSKLSWIKAAKEFLKFNIFKCSKAENTDARAMILAG